MSGFAGMISLDGATPDDRLLHKMASALAFRGPDGTHVTVQPGAGFCFTFMRTGPAPQCPSQPCTLDGRLWLLGDVRLDGRDDLRRKLEQFGEEIQADVTDEELVLRTWRLWGEEGIAELIGDYAFALWDAEARELRCWRDLMGARPFFYARAGGWFYFSNTLDVVRRLRAVSSELDAEFIGDFLLQGWSLDPGRTAFSRVSRLSAGHNLRYSEIELCVRRFATLPIEEPHILKAEQEYVDHFRALLKRALLDRLPRGPVAIFMSGGLDSTSLAAMVAQCAKERNLPLALRAFTVDYRPLFDDREGVLASLVAKHIGIPIEIQCGADYLPYSGWETSPPRLPEPYHEPFQSQYVEQNRSVAQHARVCFNGYGGEGALTGQSWPYLVYLFRARRFHEIGKSFGLYTIKRGRIPPLRGGFRSALQKWIKARDPMANYPKWLNPEFERMANLRDRWCESQRVSRSNHPWYPRAHAVLNGSAWAYTLENETPEWTGACIEHRAPLLDWRIQRFLLRVPPVPLCVNKELLRRALRGLLPDQILTRPKTPFEGDLIGLQTNKHGWTPLPLPAPQESLLKFVSWRRLNLAIMSESTEFPWVNLRPISLMHWLRAIESW